MEARRNLKPDESMDSKEIRAVERSTRLNFDLDSFFDTVVYGRQPSGGSYSAEQAHSAVDSTDISANPELLMKQLEAKGISMDMDQVYKLAANQLDNEEVQAAIAAAYGPEEGRPQTFANTHSYAEKASQDTGITNLVQENNSHANEELKMGNEETKSPGLRVSASQARALKKYPDLIDFLGREGFADRIARKMITEINNIVAEKIEQNTRTVHKHAVLCKADKQNLKQYFKGDDWVCCVTASGVFRGDEIIYYKRDRDTAYVLRQGEKDEELVDVSWQFNVVHEYEEGVELEEVENE